METRLSAQTDFSKTEKRISVAHARHLKRKAWLIVFALSAVFWIVLALVIWKSVG
ncbi:YmiA family putative membrane protein [Enterobacteriaceae bacterium LUAb1]